MTDISQAAKPVTQFEIRARSDRNRLLGTYDPERRMLRLYHRGEVITVNVNEMDNKSKGVDTPGKA